MSRTVTLRLPDNVHRKLRILAERDHRTLSNFIETATLRYVEQSQFVDEFEMEELLQNTVKKIGSSLSLTNYLYLVRPESTIYIAQNIKILQFIFLSLYETSLVSLTPHVTLPMVPFMVLLKLPTIGSRMVTVNFSVPEPVKAAFDKTFAGENKSAVLSRLMQQAIEEREREARRARAIEKLLAMRSKVKPVSAKTIRRVRKSERPGTSNGGSRWLTNYGWSG